MVVCATLIYYVEARDAAKHLITLKADPPIPPQPSKNNYLFQNVNSGKVESLWVRGIISKRNKYMEENILLTYENINC